MDSIFCTLPGAAGYPIGTAPLGTLKAGLNRPFGICVVSKAGREDLLLQFMKLWEQVITKGNRLVPNIG